MQGYGLQCPAFLGEVIMANIPMDRVLDSIEAAELLSVSRNTLYRMMRQEDFPAGCKLGSRRVWLASSLLEWVRKNGG
jgi:predicted DNA-binding transcriptional regulator AlpA